MHFSLFLRNYFKSNYRFYTINVHLFVCYDVEHFEHIKFLSVRFILSVSCVATCFISSALHKQRNYCSPVNTFLTVDLELAVAECYAL